MEIFKQAQKANPKNPTTNLNLAAAYVMKKQYADAIKPYEEVLSMVRKASYR